MSIQTASISPTELHTLQRQNKDIEIIDVRSPGEYNSGHIKGARLLPLEELQPENIEGQPARQPGDHELVYPAHDYNGMTVSTIAEEKRHNPRLQVADKQAYIDLMNGLKLDDPRLMDVAVPANRSCGLKPAA